jgi:Uma2 family endonuclease
MSIATLETVQHKRYTYTDYLTIEDEKRYEVYEGDLIMVPAPTTTHQSVSGNIEYIMRSFIIENNLGKLFYAPTDVVLSEDIVLQPDILFISKEREKIIEERAIMGAPDLIVEILSPSSTFYDVVKKKELYQRYGVKEYWLVFLQDKAIEVLTLEDDVYREFVSAKGEGSVKSKMLKGLEVELKEIF